MAPRTLKQMSQSVTITTIRSFITCYPSSPLLSNPRPPSVVCTFLSNDSVGTGATSPIIACAYTLTRTMPHANDHLYSFSLSQSHSFSHSHSRSRPHSRLYIDNRTEARDSPSHALTHTHLRSSVASWVLTCTCVHNAHAHTHSLSHSHTNIGTETHSIRPYSPKHIWCSCRGSSKSNEGSHTRPDTLHSHSLFTSLVTFHISFGPHVPCVCHSADIVTATRSQVLLASRSCD